MERHKLRHPLADLHKKDHLSQSKKLASKGKNRLNFSCDNLLISELKSKKRVGNQFSPSEIVVLILLRPSSMLYGSHNSTEEAIILNNDN